MKKFKIVLTGAPGCGKTTVIKKIAERYCLESVILDEDKLFYGFSDELNATLILVPEAARRVIRKIKAKDVNKVNDVDFRQREILKEQLKLEKIAEDYATTKKTVIVLDRGIVDGIAFYDLANIQPFLELVKSCEKDRYDAVFLLELLPAELYSKDSERRENWREAKQLEGLIKSAYEKFGYVIETIKYMSINARTEEIIKRIRLILSKI